MASAPEEIRAAGAGADVVAVTPGAGLRGDRPGAGGLRAPHPGYVDPLVVHGRRD
ncbi:hypothetical protein [Micromonospora marina]|uniref:hypothetical protein n=1 Tax=Micromonospora marina TaxID=307120 RepID=UPI003D726FDF